MSKVTVTRDEKHVYVRGMNHIEKFTPEDAWWLGHTLMGLASSIRKEINFAQYERTFKDQEGK